MRFMVWSDREFVAELFVDDIEEASEIAAEAYSGHTVRVEQA